MSPELQEKIIKFDAAHYPKKDKHLSFTECMRTITQNPNWKLDENAEFVQINGKEFQLIDLDCPDLREPYVGSLDVPAMIFLKRGTRVLQYIFDSTHDKIDAIEVYEEVRRGTREIAGKKYKYIKTYYAREGRIDDGQAISFDD